VIGTLGGMKLPTTQVRRMTMLNTLMNESRQMTEEGNPSGFCPVCKSTVELDGRLGRQGLYSVCSVCDTVIETD
jgi:hypothetical protein